MAALGWAMTSAQGGGLGLNLAGTEVGVSVGPGAGRELMLLYVGRAIILGLGISWLSVMAYAIQVIAGST
jgi:hypothetical protein